MTAATKPRLRDIRLAYGGHSTREQGVCVMELAAWLAGREHTDSPPCVDPAIAAFLRAWNDTLDDGPRQKLKPYARKVLDTNTGPQATEQRAWLATDWLVREFTPAWLRLAGLTEHAEALEKLAPLVSTAAAKLAQPTITGAREASAAAWAAARDAAWVAARDAAWVAARAAAWAAARDAAWVAARDAARDAAWVAAGAAAWAAAGAAARDAAGVAARDAAGAAAGDAAGDAARDAAGAAARDAAGDALAPTVTILQKSAFNLLDRMIAVGS